MSKNKKYKITNSFYVEDNLLVVEKDNKILYYAGGVTYKRNFNTWEEDKESATVFNSPKAALDFVKNFLHDEDLTEKVYNKLVKEITNPITPTKPKKTKAKKVKKEDVIPVETAPVETEEETVKIEDLPEEKSADEEVTETE